MRKLLLLAAAAAALSGCATSREVRQADGWTVQLIDCSGPHLNFGHCVEKAGDLCRRGYVVLNAEGGEVPASPTAMPTGGLLDVSGRMERRRLLVRCN